MFVLRQFNAKINTNYLSMTVVCLLLLLAIGITACSVGVNNTVEGNVERTAPLDMTLCLDDDYFVFEREDLPGALEEAGFAPENWLGDFAVVSRYAVKLDEPIPLAEGGRELNSVYVMSLSDFNALTALRERSPWLWRPIPVAWPRGPYRNPTGSPSGTPGGVERSFRLAAILYAPDPKACHTGALYTSEIDLSDVDQSYLTRRWRPFKRRRYGFGSTTWREITRKGWTRSGRRNCSGTSGARRCSISSGNGGAIRMGTLPLGYP